MEIKNKRITKLYFNRKIKVSDAMKRINQINVDIYWLISRRYCSFLCLYSGVINFIEQYKLFQLEITFQQQKFKNKKQPLNIKLIRKLKHIARTNHKPVTKKILIFTEGYSHSNASRDHSINHKKYIKPYLNLSKQRYHNAEL